MSYGVENDMAKATATDRPAMDADIAAGRVLYLVGREPHKGGLWAQLSEFIQLTNVVIKSRRPRHVRVMMTYDESLGPEEKR